MKNIGLLLSSVLAFFIIIGCLFYNSLLIDMDEVKDYVCEGNLIYEEVLQKNSEVDDNKGEYISRLINIKKGIENSNTSFLINKYKEVKISSIEALINTINESNEKKKKQSLENVRDLNKKGQLELNKLVSKNFVEVTYLSLKHILVNRITF